MNPKSLSRSLERGMCDPLCSRVYPLHLPLLAGKDTGWTPHPIFQGSTGNLAFFSCHASVLSTGHSPHPPHAHEEEELLLLLKGEAELIFRDKQAPANFIKRQLKAGQFVYYPTFFPHSLKTTSEEPSHYLMFKWHSEATETGHPLDMGQFDLLEKDRRKADRQGFRTLLRFEGPTTFLKKFHCHESCLAPGSGYAPHADEHDTAILVLTGEVDTLDARAASHSVIFYAAGESHGMLNPGTVPARYIVFEFHNEQTTSQGSHLILRLVQLSRHILPSRLRGKIRSLLSRIRNT